MIPVKYLKFTVAAVLLGFVNVSMAEGTPNTPTDPTFPGYQGALAAQWACLYTDNVTAVSVFGGGTYVVRQGNKVRQILNRGSGGESFNPNQYDLVDVNYYIKNYNNIEGQNCDPGIHAQVWISKAFKFKTQDSSDSFVNQPNPCIDGSGLPACSTFD